MANNHDGYLKQINIHTIAERLSFPKVKRKVKHLEDARNIKRLATVKNFSENFKMKKICTKLRRKQVLTAFFLNYKALSSPAQLVHVYY